MEGVYIVQDSPATRLWWSASAPIQSGYNMTQPRLNRGFITYRPKVVLLGSDGETWIIRENETLDTFKALERVPDYLV